MARYIIRKRKPSDKSTGDLFRFVKKKAKTREQKIREIKKKRENSGRRGKMV